MFLGGPVNELQSDDLTPLMKSCLKGQASLTKLILDMPDVDINVKNSKGINLKYF